MIELPFMNISFLRNAQAEEKEEMSYFCMHAPAADGHAAAQMPAGAGRGVPAGAAPGPPRQLQHPQPWGGHTQHSFHPRMRHHQPRNTYPAVPTWSRGARRLLASPSTLSIPHPCPRRGLRWAGSQPHIPEPTAPLCRRITPERERGCPAPPQIFPTQVEATQETRSRRK